MSTNTRRRAPQRYEPELGKLEDLICDTFSVTSAPDGSLWWLDNLGNLGPPGLVVLAVLLIFTGRLVPLRYYLRVVAECDYWREQAQGKRRRRS